MHFSKILIDFRTRTTGCVYGEEDISDIAAAQEEDFAVILWGQVPCQISRGSITHRIEEGQESQSIVT
jgi:hypothetical protein